MAEKSSAKANKPKPKPKSGGKAAKSGGVLPWLVLVGLAAGLAWVSWPFLPFSGSVPAAKAPAQTPQQMRQIATQNPEAEVFNPEGKEPGAEVKKK